MSARPSHGALTPRDDIPSPKMSVMQRAARRNDAPSVDNTRDPSEDPEKDVNPEVYHSAINGLSVSHIRRFTYRP